MLALLFLSITAGVWLLVRADENDARFLQRLPRPLRENLIYGICFVFVAALLIGTIGMFVSLLLGAF